MDKIITTFDYPPIPDRRFDYSAVRSSYDLGSYIGRGPTPQAAVLDLLDMEEGDEPAICPGCGRDLSWHGEPK
jgi:hypothetical protein